MADEKLDKENKAILEWATNKSDQNVLPIFSAAGMGKGALIANVIQELSAKDINMPVLHHFCGSGIQNSLHATLYHFIIQGKKQQLWKTEDEDILRKLNRLPSKYPDLIMLFHRLLDECFAALDVLTIKMLQETIVNLQQENKITICICDHQARDLLACVDVAMILSNGKIVAEDTPSNLVKNINAKNAYFGDSFKFS